MEPQAVSGGAVSLENNSAELRALFGPLPADPAAADRIRLDAGHGAGILEFVELAPDCNLIVSRCDWRDDMQIRYRGEGWLRMNFCLDATAVFAFDDIAAYTLTGAECRVIHQPEGIECRHDIRHRAQSLCVTLSAKRAYFARELALAGSGGQGGLAAFVGEDCPDFFFDRLPMTGVMARAVHEMVDSPFAGPLRRLHLGTKAHELVCHAWEAAAGAAPVPPLRLTDEQRRRVAEARDLLEASLDAALPAGQLARRVGLNRNQLAYGFRLLYGTSVYDYQLGRRLSAAWDMLARGDRSVAEVAYAVGYQHQASFTTAFRGHFGIAPREVRGRRHAPAAVPVPAAAG